MLCIAHNWVLETLNTLSNDLKHSFPEASLGAVGRNEPCVIVVRETKNAPRLKAVPLAELVRKYSAFFRDGLERIAKAPTFPEPT